MTERARAVAALAEALKNWAPDEAQYWHAEAEALVGPVLGLVADAVAEAVTAQRIADAHAWNQRLTGGISSSLDPHRLIEMHDRLVVAEAVRERDAAILRAYHVTLDSLGAPADEWPCNRVKALVDRQAEESARLRATIVELREHIDEWPAYTQAAVAAERASVDQLPRYNCDCLNRAPAAGENGPVYEGEDSIYCERDVILASDLAALRAAPTP